MTLLIKSYQPVYLCWKTVSTDQRDFLKGLKSANKIIKFWIFIEYEQSNIRVTFRDRKCFRHYDINYLCLYDIRLNNWTYVFIV